MWQSVRAMNISFKTFVFGTCVCGAALGVLVLPAGQADDAAAVAGNKPLPEVYTMEAAQAVMVTVEVPPVKDDPTIAGALRQVERRHRPEDGKGRVFAILDAYGERNADGKLHMSMHLSSEKPGTGELVYKPTGEVLWRGKVVPATKPPGSSFAGKGLFIMIDDDKGKSWVLDGSGGPKTILDTKVRDLKVSLRDFWADGAEREFTFVYSSCGCPVKVRVRREGESAVRTKDTPVIFPDDPAVARTIGGLMGWTTAK